MEWFFSGFYCKENNEELSKLQAEISDCQNRWDYEGVIGDDFNMTLVEVKDRGAISWQPVPQTSEILLILSIWRIFPSRVAPGPGAIKGKFSLFPESTGS